MPEICHLQFKELQGFTYVAWPPILVLLDKEWPVHVKDVVLNLAVIEVSSYQPFGIADCIGRISMNLQGGRYSSGRHHCRLNRDSYDLQKYVWQSSSRLGKAKCVRAALPAPSPHARLGRLPL